MLDKKMSRKILVGGVIGILMVYLVYQLNLHEFFQMENINELQRFVSRFGYIAPVIYIIIWVIGCIIFLPKLVLTVLGAFVFEPVRAVIYASIGSTLGATSTFLIARYGVRKLLEKKLGSYTKVEKIIKGVKKIGWRMLVITRMIPVFPYNLQNYIYGLTEIKLSTYIIVSWICTLPVLIVSVIAASAIIHREGELSVFIYLGMASILFVIITLIPKWIKEKENVEI